MGIDKTHTWEERKAHYNKEFFVDYSGHIGEDDKPTYSLDVIIQRCKDVYELFRMLSSKRITSVLDVGCATGWLIHGFNELDSSIIARGIDVSEFVVSRSDLSIRDKLVVGDVSEGLPFSDKEFDLVTGFDILEHLYPYFRILDLVREMGRVSNRWILLRQPMVVWKGKGEHHAWLETLNRLPHRVRLSLLGAIPQLIHSHPTPENMEHPSEHPRDFWIESFRFNGFNLVDLPEEIYRFPNPNTFCSYNLLVFERGIK